MKNFLKNLAKAAALLCLTPALATAQAWPSKPIKMIVPFPAGGGTDFIGRLAAKQLGDRLGQPVFVDNRGGANGAIGAQALMQSPPDGYTIAAISDGPTVINPALYEKLAYQPLRDFVPVAMMIKFPSMLTAHPSTGLHSVADLIAQAKAKPGALNYSSGGTGNFSHLGLELLAYQAGIKLTHVPYRGVGPATMALLAGDVQLMYNNVATALEYVRAGRMTALAVGEAQRLPALPDIPAIAETVPGFEFAAWVGIFAPAKTPKEIVARVSRETAAFLKDPEVLKIFSEQQIVASYRDSEDFAAYIRKELDKWAGVIKTLGIKGE
ncbi:MAG TPA: tripartite tricarboxylate transporter substrate binding protein [Burkholderiales bacterium]